MSILKPEFVSSLSALGPIADGLADTLSATPPETAVRVNPARRHPLQLLQQGSEPVPWAPEGHYLASRPRFTLDPALHQGRYYVQDPSSMIAGHIVRQLFDPAAPLVALDACAAPGGKSTALVDSLPGGSLLVANEVVPKRAAILKENLLKWGSPRTVVTRGDTSQIAAAFDGFDLILADAPCSGEGMMRKEPAAAGQWSASLVEECAALQRTIADNLWEALRPGGVMIYGTCTFNRTEDEEVVRHILDSHDDAECIDVAVDPSWGIVRVNEAGGVSALRFLPGRVRGEGLFVSVLRKRGSAPGGMERLRSRRSKRQRLTPDQQRACKESRQWLADPDAYVVSAEDDRLNAMSPELDTLCSLLQRHVDIIHNGVPLAVTKGRDLIPTHALALSAALRRGVFPEHDVDLDTALRYLRREAVTLPAGMPRGYLLLTYEHEPLGFVKNLGNRSNNLYPSEYRILHG